MSLSAQVPRRAAAGRDVITTCTADKSKATVLTTDMVEPGTHINAIGGDCPGKTELAADVLHLGPGVRRVHPANPG